jgi:HSP20 family protein
MALGNLIPWTRARQPISRCESMSPLFAFQDQVNRLFDEFWRDFDGAGSSLSSSFGYPRVEMSETARELKVEAELPGLDEKDVEVLLRDGELILRGERKSETEDEARRVSERYYGRFERRIALPAEVDEDKVSASFKKGILTVTLPKLQQALEKVKRIAIDGK